MGRSGRGEYIKNGRSESRSEYGRLMTAFFGGFFMILTKCTKIATPFLTDGQLRSLYSGRIVDSPFPMRVGDFFITRWKDETFPVFCSSSAGGRCRIRRMRPKEIEYSEKQGGRIW